jgi:hypothetical protein
MDRHRDVFARRVSALVAGGAAMTGLAEAGVLRVLHVVL